LSGSLHLSTFCVKTIGIISGFEVRWKKNIIGIASLLSISKSCVYALVKAHPAEVPKHLDDVESRAAFVDRYRIEPTGNDRIRLSPRERRR
jgi:hypothetical protein